MAEGCGLTTVVNARQTWHLRPGLPRGRRWSGPEARIKAGDSALGPRWWGADWVQGGKNMISYLLFWIKTLYLWICSSGEQTLLNYTKESHWAKPFISSQTWTAPCQAPIWDSGTCAALRPDPGFQGTRRISPAPPTSPMYLSHWGRAKSCPPPTAATTHTTPHQGPMQSTVFRS